MKKSAAEVLAVKEVEAVLDGQFCEWRLTYDEKGQDVFCEKPAWLKVSGELLCPFHASLRPKSKERLLEFTRFCNVEGHPRAEIIALRDSRQQKMA